MKATNAKRKLVQHRFQYWQQMPFRNGFHTAHHLPLLDGVHGVEVIQTRLAVAMPLMHRVYSQEAGLTLGIGSAPFADRYLTGTRVFDLHPQLAISLRPPQIV